MLRVYYRNNSFNVKCLRLLFFEACKTPPLKKDNIFITSLLNNVNQNIEKKYSASLPHMMFVLHTMVWKEFI